MCLENNKKALYWIHMESNSESYLQQVANIEQENMLIYKSFGSMNLHPYGDLMRSIILAIYHENVEEVIIVGTNEEKNSVDFQGLLNNGDESLKRKMRTVNYLFENCMPEFPGDNIDDVVSWLNGSGNVAEEIQRSVNTIRNHPLIPSYIKVQGYIMDNAEGNFIPSFEVPEHQSQS